jgi:hypothetical protein
MCCAVGGAVAVAPVTVVELQALCLSGDTRHSNVAHKALKRGSFSFKASEEIFVIRAQHCAALVWCSATSFSHDQKNIWL